MLSTAPICAYIPASNLSRARKFYEEKVGLNPKEDYAGGVIYECGGAEVFMYLTHPRPARHFGGSTTWKPRWPT